MTHMDSVNTCIFLSAFVLLIDKYTTFKGPKNLHARVQINVLNNVMNCIYKCQICQMHRLA